MIPPIAAATAPHRSPAERLALLALLGFLLLWGGWFVWRTSFEAAGQRTFCLFDDAMISMTYAENLLAGKGLNWARFGAPVEGFTHPLWLAVMVIAHLLPVGRLQMSLVMQAVSLVLLLANVLAVRTLSLRHFSGTSPRRLSTWLPAAVLTATYYPLNHWALQGMESALQALLVTLAVLWSLDLAERERPRRLALLLGMVLALAYLLRMDMALLALACCGFLLRANERLNRRGWRELATPVALAAIGYQIFRWTYFGDWLPNTYYLKLAGYPLEIRILRGLWSFSTFFLWPAIWGVLAIAIALLPLLRRHRGSRLPAAILVLFSAYSIYVGGDVWEAAGIGANRFMCFALPLYFVLGNAALVNLRETGIRPLRRLLATPATSVVLTLGLFASFNGLQTDHREVAWSRLLVLDPPLHVPEHRRFTRMVLGIQAAGLVDRDARVVVVWAGLTAYFSSWEMVDLLGYNERWIARQPVLRELTTDTYRNYLPGHLKVGHEYVLDTYQPDVVLQFWGLGEERERELLRQKGYTRRGSIWLREGSPKVRQMKWPLRLEALEEMGQREPAAAGSGFEPLKEP